MSGSGGSGGNQVERIDELCCRVQGVFYRAVAPEHRAHALDGSRLAGRYSTTTQPTLYLSASPEGVAAALVAHDNARAADRSVVAVEVDAERIIDLRDPVARSASGVQLADAIAPWQDIVAAGGEPASWRVRRRLEEVGAHGLIDPSRKAPGLWHLTLFQWNRPGAPRVALR